MRIPIYYGTAPDETPVDEDLDDDAEAGSAPVEESRATVRESEEDADEV